MSGEAEKTISGLRVCIARDNCIGTGSCTHVAPEVFEIDGQQKVCFTPAPPDIDRERLIEACDVCPVDALDVFDEDGNSLIA